MSRENLEGFSKFLMENKDSRAKLKSLGGDVAALAAFAKESGYDVTAEELCEYQEKALIVMKSRVQSLQPGKSLSAGAKAFYDMIKAAESDMEMAKRVAELSSGSPEELIAYGREKGFIFNEQDMQAVGKEILEPSDELSEEELEMVAGGEITLLLSLVFLALVAAGAGVGAGVGLAAGAGAAVGVAMLVDS